MIKAKKWQGIVLTVLSLLFFMILGFAVGQVVPAGAEDIVLEENTAEYTFRDFTGEERGQAGYWNNTFFPYDFTYKPETNEWVSPTNYSKIFGLELTVTSVPGEGNGVVAFQWKINKLISDYPQMALTVKKISVSGEETPIVNGGVATEANVNTYTKVIVSELSKGDKVRIEFDKGNQATFTIQGLKKPGKDIAMTAQIQEGDGQHGTIKTELDGEAVDENGVLTAKRGWGESVTFTAEPNEGYAAVWYKVTGEDREFAGAGSVSLSEVSGSHNNLQLIARFIPKGGEPEVSFGTPSSKGAQWQMSEGRYTISNLTALERGEEVNLRVLTTSKYFKFTYAFAGGATASEFRTDHYSGSPSITAYVDGTRLNNLSNTYEIGSETVETTCYVALPEGQAHIIEIEVKLSNSSRENPNDKVKYPISEIHEGCSVLFKDFEQMDEMIDEAPTIHFYYNPHLAELTINGEKVDQDDKSQTVDYEVHVKYMEEVTYSFQKRSNVISSIDGKTPVTVKYVDTTTNTSYDYWEESDLTSDPHSTTLSFWKTNAPSANLTKHYSGDYDEKSSANITDGSNELKIYQNYQEVNSLSPEVEVVQSIDGITGDAQEISGNEVLEFPWAKNNSLIVNIKAYANVLTLDNFLIIVDGKPYDTQNMELSGDNYLFVITDVTNLSVSISYVTNGSYQFSGKTISFSAHETVEGSMLKDIVKTDELVVKTKDTSNEGVMEWQFDPYRSEEENYAYWGYLPSTTSYDIQRDLFLNFSMGEEVDAESGSISFEFQLKSYVLDGLLKSSYSGQLYYQADKEFTFGQYVSGSEDGNLILRDEYKGDATFLAGVLDKGGDVKTGGGVIKQDNGWYRVSIPIKKGQTIYLAYFMGSGSFSAATDETWFSIRNLRLNTGTANVTLAKCGDSKGFVKATVDTQEHDAGQGFAVAVGTAIDLEATLGSGERFYGWALNDGSVLSTEERFTYFAEKDCTITAYMAKDGTYAARIEGVYYKDLQTALTSAQENQIVTVVENDLQITSDLTVRKGVTLLLPYNAAGGFMETGTSATAANQISWYGTTYQTAYITLTVKNNAKITVEGTLRVGGIVNDTSVSNGYQGHTSGAYSEIILEKGTSIQVANGGVMDVYGRVWGGTGKTGADMGTIDVAEGGKLYEPFLILDYTGGSNALASFTAQTTPFKRYAMVNIEVPLTVNYGAQLFGHASLWVPSFNLLASLDQPFISYDMGGKLGGDGNGNDTFIMLHKGASVKITYDSAKTVKNATTANCTEGIGETTMIFEGGATFSYMLFSAMGLTVPTSPVVFSIPYNFQIEMNAGSKSGEAIDETYNQYETKTDFMLMPGSTVKVGEKATLTLNADTWVLDGYAGGKQAGKQYPSKDDLAPNYSASGNLASGNLIVNGTLKIGQKTPGMKFEINIGGSSASGGSDDTSPRPAIFLGVVQTTGTTGRIEIPADTGLKGKIWAGLNNQDYFAYTTTARVWVANLNGGQGGFVTLEAGKTYTATGSNSFTLPSFNYKTSEEGKEDQSFDPQSNLQGSWMEEHGEAHEYDWTPSADEKPTAEKPWQTLTRKCTVLGCDHQETKYLLYKFDSITPQTYKGTAFTTEELADFFKAMYNKTAELPAGVKVTATCSETVQSANEYHVEIELEGAWFLGEGDAREATATLTFTVNKKAIEVTILDQEATYSGSEPTVSQTAYTTVDGALCEGDTLGIIITKAEGVKAHAYNLTAKEAEGSQYANGNYTITFKYSNEEGPEKHSVFTIKQAKLTVTVRGNSPQKEELKYTFEVSGYVNNESNLLGENVENWWESKFNIGMPVGFTKDSVPGDYDITLSWKEGQEVKPENYEVVFAENCKYTISAAVFNGLKFSVDGKDYDPNSTIEIVFDGKAHEVTVTGVDEIETSFTGGVSNTQTNAGTYSLKATVTKGEYHQEFSVTLTIKQLDVHVTLLTQEKTYDGKKASESISSEQDAGWKFTTENFKLCGEDAVSVLGIVLSAPENANAGTYDVTTQSNQNGNYKVIFDNAGKGLYKIDPKRINVTVTDVVTTYGDGITLNQKGFTFNEKLLVGDDKISITLTTDAQDAYRAEPYTITGTAAEHSEQNDNYDIHIENGTWTVNKKAITIVITPVEVTYSGEEPAAPTAWTFKAGSALVNGDENTDLHVVLTKKAGGNADKYNITGTWTNENYDVTFEGGEDAYTVNKKDISEEGDFFLTGEGVNEEGGRDGRLVATYAGEDIGLTGYVLLGSEPLEVKLVLTPDKITGIGDFDVTVTVDDVNYSGSKTFHLVVTNADGYTKKLVDTLAELAELTDGMTAETLKAEDFEALKEAAALIAALDDDEKDVAEEQLAAYEALIAAWNESAEGLDAKIGTAQSIGDALLDGLFGVAATVSALAAVAFVLRKGGIL